VLKQLDLVRMRADGNVRWHRLKAEALEKIMRSAFSCNSIADFCSYQND
jgi:hypothetical protein